MWVSVAYAEPMQQRVLELELPEGSTVEQAVLRSGLIGRIPELDLAVNKVGIFGKLVGLDQTVSDGDRVEIYRPALGKPPKKDRGEGREGAADGEEGPVAAVERKAAPPRPPRPPRTGASAVSGTPEVAEATAAVTSQGAVEATAGGDAGAEQAAKMAAAKERAAAARARATAARQAREGGGT